MSGNHDRCPYCGATLNPAFYFCPSCATPHQDEDRVLPVVPRLRLTTGQRIAQRAPAVSRLFWTYFAGVLGAAIVAHVFIGDESPGFQLLLLYGVLFVLTAFFTIAYWRSLVPQLKRPGFDVSWAWAGLAMLVPLLALNYVYHSGLQDLIGAESESIDSRLRAAGLSDAAVILCMCVFPAITEEIAFRGLVQHWLQVAVRPFMAIALASALFSAMHFNVLSAPYLFLAGCLMGWAKWKTGSLYPSMVIHFLHNYAVVEWLPD